MSTQQRTVDFLTDQIATAGVIAYRKMFGEYAIYCDTKVVALVCDDQLFVKPTEFGRKFITKLTEARPYPGAKKYFLIADDKWDDSDWLSELIRKSARELPMPKRKK